MLVAPTALVALKLFWHPVERTACRWLAVFLLAFCLDTVPQIIGFAGAYSVWPWLTFAPFNYQPFFGPLIYLHAHALMRKTPPGKLWWLLLPGAVHVLYYCWAFAFLGDYKAKWAFNDAVHMPYIEPVQFTVSVALAVGSAIATGVLLLRYRRFLADTQSIAAELDPSWLTRFIAAVGIAFIAWLGFEAVNRFITPLGYTAFYPMFLVIGALLLWMGLEALSRIRTAFVPLGETPEAPAPSTAADKDWRTLGKELKARLVDEQWHLEPRLTLGDLAERTATNETYVSRALNLGLGVNFNRLVNDARIDTAKRLMVDQPEARLLDIAHQAGFNSKATFNRVFRDSCAATPSAWRRTTLGQQTSQIQ